MNYGKDWAIFAMCLRPMNAKTTTNTLVMENYKVQINCGLALVTEFVNVGDSVAKMSRRVGISANDLSLLGHAAEQSGSSLDDLGNSMRYLQRNLAEAGRGGKAATEAFERLGISFHQLQLLDPKKQFLMVAEAIKKLGNETLQADAAMKIFGRNGAAMLPMFQEGADGIRKLMQEASDYGIGISDKDAASAEALNDSLTRLSQSFQGLRTSFTSTFAEDLANTFNWIAKNVKAMREWIDDNRTLVQTITKAGSIAVGIITAVKSVSLLRAGLAALLPVSVSLTAAEQANAAAVNATTAAIVQETTATVANTAAKRANAAAKAAAYNEFKKGAIYGLIGDQAKYAKEIELSLQAAYKQGTASRIAAASATNTIALAETRATATRKALTISTIAQTAATKASTAATAMMTTTTNVATKAMLALKASMVANPVMWIAGAVAAVVALTHALTTASDKAAELRTEMSERREQGDRDRAVDDKKFRRLEQLASAQKLSNGEIKEAQTLVDELTGKYGDFGAALDEVAGKLTLTADAMKNITEGQNRTALQQMEAELAEAQAYLDEINEEGERINMGLEGRMGTIYMVTAGLGRTIVANTTGWMNTVGEQKAAEIEVWEKEWDKALKARNEVRKKINTLKGGEDARDVAKGEALHDDRLGNELELEKMMQELSKIERQRDRERKSSLENEIADLKDRNEEYKKYLQLLIEAEQSKHEDMRDKDSIAGWQAQLEAANAELIRDIDRVRAKVKIDAEKFSTMTQEVHITEKRMAVNDAIQSGDMDAIQKARAELAKAKEDLEKTSYKNVKASLDKARAEYTKALEEFHNAQRKAEEGDDPKAHKALAIAEQSLRDAMGNLETISSQFENLSERIFDKKIENIAKGALSQGTFNKADILGSAFNYMSSEKDYTEDIAKNTEEMVTLLKAANVNIRNNQMRFA